MKYKARYMHWQIAYRTSPKEPFQMVPNPAFAWAADPFLTEYEGKIYLFAELFLYKSERNGVIGYCEFRGDHFSEWKVAMDEHWHLSYPNVFVRNGKLYMCPESYQKREVGIYELQKFPNQWKQVETLFTNVQYVDTTFLEYEDEQYIFTFRPTFKGDEGMLLLYRREAGGKLSDPIEVTDDVGCARPGGNLIQANGKLYRVSQDSTHFYGDGIVFSEIDALWPTYREHAVKRMTPENQRVITGEKVLGMHTYNRCGKLEVIDVRYYKPSFGEYLAAKRTHKVFLNKY